jgi:hypothetical protein
MKKTIAFVFSGLLTLGLTAQKADITIARVDRNMLELLGAIIF